MNPIIVSHIKAFVLTFISTFLVALGTALAGAPGIEFTSTAIVALLISAAQTALKEVLERNTTKKLGGRKV